jgi:hypothetical protein
MKSPFSYVVLRYMHDVFTREFVNIGVVVFCPQTGFLQMKGLTRMKRALGLFPGMDRCSVLKTLRFMESRFAAYLKSSQQSLPFETLDAASIAKAILPTDDSSLQWSAPGGGATGNPAQVLEELFERMVTRHEDKHPAFRRTDEEVWQPFETALRSRDHKILSSLHEQELAAGSFRHRFEHAWQPQQGPLHLLLPLSFDLVDPSNIVDKAIGWNGRIHLLRKSAPDFKAFLLIGRPSDQTHESAYAEAKAVLESETGSARTIVPEEEATAFADEFSRSVISQN